MVASTKGFSLLEGDELRKKSKGLAYRVLVFEPKGWYPRGTRFVPNGFFHACENMAFSVVEGEAWDSVISDPPYSDFNWISPQELRLITSLILCELTERARICFYPVFRHKSLLDAENIDLSSDETVSSICAMLHDRAKNPVSTSVFSEDNITCCLAKPYQLVNPEVYDLDRLIEFWNAVPATDFVLLRGAYALMRSDMLSRHREFHEEALISLYIALDASFSLVIRKLKASGLTNPSAHDAALWVHEHFDGPLGLSKPGITEKYFQEFHEQRVTTLHPASRFGDIPFPAMMYDDLYHLRDSLRSIFAYLATGKHGKDYLEDLELHKKMKMEKHLKSKLE